MNATAQAKPTHPFATTPWAALGLIRDDLRQAKGLLRRALSDLRDAHTAPGERELRLALGKVDDALERIGGGE